VRATAPAPVSEDLPTAYERWRASRLGRITDALEDTLVFELAGSLPGRRVLDVGCGDGRFALALAQAGAQVSAVDADPQMVEAARRRFHEAGCAGDILLADASALPFADGRFDLVTAITVLCFLTEPAPALAEIARVLRPGGRLVLGELARASLWALWRRLKGRLGDPIWRAARFRSARELRALAQGAGLEVDTVRAAVFYPPLGPAAALLAPIDPWLGRRFTTGGAFLVLRATKPEAERDMEGRPQ